MLSHQAEGGREGEAGGERRETSDGSWGRDKRCTRAIDHDSDSYRKKKDGLRFKPSFVLKRPSAASAKNGFLAGNRGSVLST